MESFRSSVHPEWVIEIAEIVTQGRYDGSERYATTYGDKTCCGVAGTQKGVEK
ncbi:hypothetical protein LCGC14_1224320 [marine sediment metagenome]|uniref:Uncharacterized protein n=1 Tax=marine sediment metagenome TaxID=412755 RepID=A0A0F9LXL3_9ZZZZ